MLKTFLGAQVANQPGDRRIETDILRKRAINPGRPREDKPEDPIGKPQRDVHGHRRSQRDATDHGAIDLQMIQECDEVLGQGGDRQPAGIAQRMRLAMPAGVKAQETNPRRRMVDRERLAQVAAETVLEHEWEPLPLVAVMKLRPS